jgi:plastocyanin
MKKPLLFKTYFSALALSVFAFTAPVAKATIHMVTVANNSFTPQQIPGVVVGDTIQWNWSAGTHTTTSQSVPAGAATWDSPITSGAKTFQYKVTVAGLYVYVCTPHAPGMAGGFQATGTSGISTPSNNFSISFYPNPVKENSALNIQSVSGHDGRIMIHDVLGKEVSKQTIEVFSGLNRFSLPIADRSKGIYFVSIFFEDKQVAIVKLLKD